MKRILWSAAVLASVLASCQNEATEGLQSDGNVSVKAVMGADSRTMVDENGTVTWTAGDKMLVYGGNSQGTLTLTGEAGGTEGTFSGYVQGSLSELTTALYPASMADNKGNITLTSVTYPNSNAPMVATWNKNGLQFSHLTGMVRLTIFNVPEGGGTLTVTSSTDIAGTANWNGKTLDVVSPSKTMTVNIPANNESGKLVVDVPVFASTSGESAGLTVTLNNMSYKTKNETANATTAAFPTTINTTLKAGALTRMLEMEVVDNELTDRVTGVHEVTNGTDLKQLVTSEEVEEGDVIRLTSDYTVSGYAATEKLVIEKAIVLDLNGCKLTTESGWGGIDAKGGCTIKNGTIEHTGNTAAIKAFQVKAIEDVTINLTQTEGKTKGGIVVQEGASCYVGTIRNVTINGATNGIETFRCGNRTDYAIARMSNVTIDAIDTGILLSAPVGTATGCTIKGGNIGINMYLYGPYSVSINMVDCTVTGTTGIYAHDEVGKTNPGSLTLNYDAETVINGGITQEFEDEVLSRVSINK